MFYRKRDVKRVFTELINHLSLIIKPAGMALSQPKHATFIAVLCHFPQRQPAVTVQKELLIYGTLWQLNFTPVQ